MIHVHTILTVYLQYNGIIFKIAQYTTASTSTDIQ